MLDNSINNALNVKVESFSDYRRITKNYSSNSFPSPFLGAKSYDFCDIKNQELNYEILKEQFETIYNKQGIIGKSWDFFKNLIGHKNSSKNIKKMLEDNKLNLTGAKETKEAIEKYYDKQKKVLDFAGDMCSCSLSLAMFSLIMPLGASLMTGLGCCALVGALGKMAVKKADAISAKREYKSAAYDSITGMINGVLSPVVTGLGNAFVRKIAPLLKVTTTNSRLAYQGIIECGSIYAKKIFSPAQKAINGKLINRIILFLSGQAVKKVSKITLSTIMRKIAFDAFTNKNEALFSSAYCKRSHALITWVRWSDYFGQNKQNF